MRCSRLRIDGGWTWGQDVSTGFAAAGAANCRRRGGIAKPGHVCDPDVSGIWRPATHSDFFSDDPKQPLITIGTGYAANGLNAAVGAVSQMADIWRNAYGSQPSVWRGQ